MPYSNLGINHLGLKRRTRAVDTLRLAVAAEQEERRAPASRKVSKMNTVGIAGLMSCTCVTRAPDSSAVSLRSVSACFEVAFPAMSP